MAAPVTELIETRFWQEADFPAAVVLNREAEEHIGIGSESGDWEKDMEGISETFFGSGGEFQVGHLDGKMVVMGGFKLHSPVLAEIKRMRVSPELQGQGVGPWFLDLLETSMRKGDIPQSIVSTLSIQTSAIKLYTRAGYSETGRKELTEGPEKGFTVVSFAKSLTYN